MNYRKLPDGITLPYKRLPKVLTAVVLLAMSASASAAPGWISKMLAYLCPSTFS